MLQKVYTLVIVMDQIIKFLSFNNKFTLIRSYSTSVIKSLKFNIISDVGQQITTLGIEIIGIEGNQLPIVITIAYINDKGDFICKIFEINSKILLNNPDLALFILWCDFFNFIKKTSV